MSIDNDIPVPECGKRLKIVREQLKFNQKDFAKRLGVSNTLINQMESGKRNLSNPFIKKVAEHFNINPTWLLLGKGSYYLNPLLPGNSTAGSMFLPSEPELDDLIWHCLNSQAVKYSVLGHFFKFLHQNKSLIEGEIRNKPAVESPIKDNG